MSILIYHLCCFPICMIRLSELLTTASFASTCTLLKGWYFSFSYLETYKVGLSPWVVSLFSHKYRWSIKAPSSRPIVPLRALTLLSLIRNAPHLQMGNSCPNCYYSKVRYFFISLVFHFIVCIILNYVWK